MADNSTIDLTPRQALISAAVTGRKGDGPSSWHCPLDKKTILEMAASYSPAVSVGDFDRTFTELVSEGLCHMVLYPVFEQPQFYCGYWSDFLKELPEPLADYISPSVDNVPVTKPSVAVLWDHLFEKFSAECGIGWMYWGLCLGQGSEGGTHKMGPCLGPSCYWFQRGSDACHHGLRFIHSSRDSYPDMQILSLLRQEEWRRTDQEEFCARTIKRMGLRKVS